MQCPGPGLRLEQTFQTAPAHLVVIEGKLRTVSKLEYYHSEPNFLYLYRLIQVESLGSAGVFHHPGRKKKFFDPGYFPVWSSDKNIDM